MAENAIISDLEFAPQLTDDMVFAVEDTQNTYSSTLGMLRGQLNKIFVERKDVDFNTLTDDGFYQVSGNLNNAPVAGSITWLVQVVKDVNTIVQIVFGLDTVNYLRSFARRWNGSTWTSWAVIGGKIIQSLTASTTDIPCSKAVQDAVNSKQGVITGGATSIVSNNLTASRALVSDGSGKVAVSAVTSTELNYLDGATSNIQAQINARAKTDLSNVSSNIAFVIEKYENGTSGYIVFSNGFCEQWGAISLTANQVGTVSLLKNFKNTNYCVTNNKKLLDINQTDNWGASDFTVSSFKLANGHGSTVVYNWHAVGFVS